MGSRGEVPWRGLGPAAPTSPILEAQSARTAAEPKATIAVLPAQLNAENIQRQAGETRISPACLCRSVMKLLHANAVLDAVTLLCALGVVEAVQRAHQIAGDAADAVEGLLLIMIGQLHILAVHADVDDVGLAAVKLRTAGDVGVYLLLRQRAAGDVNRAHGESLHILCLYLYYSTECCDVKRNLRRCQKMCNDFAIAF